MILLSSTDKNAYHAGQLINRAPKFRPRQLTFTMGHPRDRLHWAASVDCLPTHTVLCPDLYRPGHLGHDKVPVW